MMTALKRVWWSIAKVAPPPPSNAEEFRRAFLHNLKTCPWEPHPLYSVFTQYDQELYLSMKEAFLHKYRCFYAVSKTISPRKLIELGVSAGSSADAYLSASPHAAYIGLDTFGEPLRHADQSPWKSYEIAQKLFQERGFRNYELVRVNLRTLDRLPGEADLVVVDAAHDFENEYADLRLALTGRPRFIFVDDSSTEEAKLAIDRFLNEDVRGRVDYTFEIDYVCGGLVIKLKS